MEEEIEIFVSKQDLVRNGLKSHYLNILQSGEVTKKNGVNWIIHNLWKINVVIYPSMLPGFVDKQARNYIFKYSNLDFQNIQLRARILYFKTWVKDQLVLKNGGKIQSLLKNFSQPTLVNPSEFTKYKIKQPNPSQTSNLSASVKMLKRSNNKKLSMYSSNYISSMEIPKNFFNSVKKEHQEIPEPEILEEYKYPNE